MPTNPTEPSIPAAMRFYENIATFNSTDFTPVFVPTPVSDPDLMRRYQNARQDRPNPTREYSLGGSGQPAPSSPTMVAPSTRGRYEFELEPDRDWSIEYKGKKSKSVEITVSKETLEAINSIGRTIIAELQADVMEQLHMLLFNLARDEYEMVLRLMENGVNVYDAIGRIYSANNSLKALMDGRELACLHNSFFRLVEDKAREAFDIEHSKYKYYPRLKKSVTYGNTELLKNIICVTQLPNGRVICQK